MTVEAKKVILGTTSSEILALNIKRRYALIINDSPKEVYLAFGTSAIQEEGIVLTTRGSSYEMVRSQNFNVLSINGIGTTGLQRVTVQSW